jgi:hypothetical protein
VDLADVMQAVSDRLDTIAGLRCFAHPPGTVTPPAAVVSYPDKYTFDETYGRGMDRITLPVVVWSAGKVSDRSARDQLGRLLRRVRRLVGQGGAGVRHVHGVRHGPGGWHRLRRGDHRRHRLPGGHRSIWTSRDTAVAMSFVHGKNTVITVATARTSVAVRATRAVLTRGADVHDVTTYGKNDHVSRVGC